MPLLPQAYSHFGAVHPVSPEESRVVEFATGLLLCLFYRLFGSSLGFNATSIDDIGLLIPQTASLSLLYKSALIECDKNLHP
jgi:hypothetical protein